MTRILSFGLGVVLIVTASGASVFCRSNDEPAPRSDTVKTAPNPAPVKKDNATTAEKLKGDMQKLVADAKAGKVAPRAQRTNYPKRNNLSTGAKIGIIAAIAGAIVAIWIFHEVNSD